MLLTGSGEKQAAGPLSSLLYPERQQQPQRARRLLSDIFRSFNSTRTALKNDKKCEKSHTLSLRRRERDTKGRIFEREHLRCCARFCCWCFSHVHKMRLSLRPALTPPLDLCNYADEVLYTFAYLSLHQTLAFGSREKILMCQKQQPRPSDLMGAKTLRVFFAPLLREHLGNRIALKLTPGASDAIKGRHQLLTNSASVF